MFEPGEKKFCSGVAKPCRTKSAHKIAAMLIHGHFRTTANLYGTN
jgi:hypothetical protein